MQQFFYSGQVRRYITQFIRMVSNFQVEFGRGRDGSIALQRVPVIYGDSSRQAASIIRQNSENSLNSVPVMAVYVSDMQYDRDRVQNPTFVGKLNLRERYYEPSTGEYSTQQGDAFTVERLMPVPYKLTLKLDIWTSNTEQKLQLLEQLTILFNPALEIQSTDNYVDWTSLTYVLLTNLTWSSRTVPMGTENPIDIATLTFELPIFVSAPALVKKLGVVQKIIASVFDSSGNIDEAIYDDANLISRQYITPMQYGVILLENQLRLVKYNEPVDDQFGQQVVKKLSNTISSNVNLVLDNTDGVKPGMLISGLYTTGSGTISSNTASNVLVGVGTSFTSDLYANAVIYYNSTSIGSVASVVNDTQIILNTNASGNVSSGIYSYFNNIAGSNCTVISVNGNSVVSSNVVSATSGQRIVFSAVTKKYGVTEPWRDIVNIYGNLINGSSQVRLELDSTEVVGTVAYNPVDDTTLLWTADIDTLPTNTLVPVNAIIDPNSSRPAKDLQNLANGTRYLLVGDYTTANGEQPTYNWMGIDNTPLIAFANDIIQYNGEHWIVAFDSAKTPAVNYVTNMTTNTQYRWSGKSWTKSYEGYYEAGKWTLVI